MKTKKNIKKAPKEVIINDNAKIVLSKRYLKKDFEGNIIETPTDLFWRVANVIANEENKYTKSSKKIDELTNDFFELMADYKFLPNSPTLMNAGNELGQLAACFVLPIEDSMEGIFDSVKYAALIHKSGGGTGFSFSRLRPKNSRVGSTGGVASGPLSFLRIFNTATEQVKQGGTRRGANMGILRVDHPDIIEFIKAKEQDGDLNNFNLSIALTEKFMEAVDKNEEYSLISPHDNKEVQKLKAKEIFEMLVKKAWESGDPGIIFIDRINIDNPTPKLGEIESTNPCGEQPLLPYEACNLGSINVSKIFNKKIVSQIDWDELKRIIHLAVRFLDNVIDASLYPLDKISDMVHSTRKIGLGLMGFADLLYQLEIPYNSTEAINLAEKLMQFINNESKTASKILAEERGFFPEYPDSIYAQRKEGPYRNATTTTIAPTGTLSIIANCSSGVEPLFALSFSRNVMDGEKLIDVNLFFKQALQDSGNYSEDLMTDVSKIGSIQCFEFLPEKLRYVFITAMDIEPIWHLKMQAAFQKYTDNAVSKTVNLPNNASIEDIYNIYWMSYKMGCKGVTVYRDGSKKNQVLCTGNESDKANLKNTPKTRPECVSGFTQKLSTGLGDLYLTVNEIDGQPFEVFATIGRSGRSITAKAEAIGRLVSLALRSGVHVKAIVNQLKGIGGEHPVFRKKGMLLSIPDAVSWVLENRYLQNEKTNYNEMNSFTELPCPECDGKLIFEEGCYICKTCAYTKCG